ncbi:MAG: FAD-dependent oxidoreductase [Chloroflexi bacterium]|nr:FAD-dependent oxidoreductase [Chloroflexota bacterium]
MAEPRPNGDSVADVVILGGGIAGIAAALELLDAGFEVTLIEARSFLGGRAFSFTDRVTGLELDNGQHVTVACCTHFIGFLERLGVRESWHLQDRLRIPVLDRSGRKGKLAASRLPSPFHLLPSFIAYPHLGPLDKLRALAGMMRARLAHRNNPRLEEITFYQWLRENWQSERAINNLWNLVVEPTLNDHVRDVSAAMGLMIVQEGMLAGAHSADLGYARKGLLASIGRPARRLLEDRGARLVLNSPVRQLSCGPRPDGTVNPAPVCAVNLASGEEVRGRNFISALPFNVLLDLLPEEQRALPFFSTLKNLQWSPIVNLHILYDRPIMREPFCVFVDSPLQWVFNRSLIEGRPTDREGQLLTVSVSAAWQFAEMPREELTEMLLREMAEVFPAANIAGVKSVNVVKQRNATFRCLPGANHSRPGAATPLPNLYMAGEWTNTGWPSTMEGAVRSGYSAARAVIDGQGPLPGLEAAGGSHSREY